MSENNFDKHILDEMSHLRIKPGPHLWAQVQADLRKRRRRRIIAFILPFLIIGSIGGFWYFNQPTKPTSKQTFTNLNQVDEENFTLIDTIQNNSNKINTDIVEDKLASNKVIAETNPPKNTQPTDNSILISKKLIQTKSIENSIENRRTVQFNADHHKMTSIQEFKDSSKSAKDVEVLIAENKDLKINEPIENTKLIDSVSGESIALNLPDSIALIDSVLASTPPKPSKKWRFGLQLTAGEAGVGSGNLANSLFKSSMVYNSSPGERTSNYYTNKEELHHRANKYYDIGLLALKPISNRLSFQTGIAYQYYSTSTNVGWRIVEQDFTLETERLPQSPNVIYYAPGSRVNEAPDQLFAYAMPIESQEFNNYWHFVSVPMQMNYLLTPIKSNIGISWMAGVKYQRLIAEEVVHFDEKNGIMFRMDDLVNKNQFTIHTGFNLELFRNNRLPVSVTPTVGYQANQFYKSNPKSNHHSWMGGVSIGIKLF